MDTSILKIIVKATDFLPITDGFACPFVDGYNDHVIKLRRKKGYPLNGNVSDHGTRDTPVLKRHGYCILISSWTQDRYRKYFYVRSSETPHCPCCGSSLRVIGSRSRVLKENDGSQKKLIIRRMRCDSCERIHHELPDILVPFKRYGSETIESVLTSPADNGVFPCETSTASRLCIWFSLLRHYFEGCLRSLMFIYCHAPSLIAELNSLIPLDPHALSNGWLKRLVRSVVNSSRWPQTRFAYTVQKSFDRITSSQWWRRFLYLWNVNE